MSEKTRKILVYLSLPLAIAWGVWSLTKNKATTDSEGVATIEALTAEQVSAPVTAVFDTAAVSQMPWGRDPFESSSVPRPAAPEALTWVVSGIMYNSSSPIAYVNREMVHEGDTIADATVIKIDKRSVTLEYQGSQITISVTKG